MSDIGSAAGVTAGYAQKVTEDLAANTNEQERVRAELARLQGELLQLEESEQVLVKMQAVLAEVGKPEAAHVKSKKKAAVPAARRGTSTTGQGKATRRSNSSKARSEESAREAAPVKGAVEETWVSLIESYLTDHSGPKSAAEVSTALTEAHPRRKVQQTVVRNSLEQGVARGLLTRSKQGRSVYYTAAAASSSVTPAASVQ
ncbi:hypothetical protein ACIBI8_36660 [Streptomyces sp. NPDC050529]|uniref:hypothetical protein n=1 Tax=unclassified Streptomyces TaxID=2593676 RepID=UPI002DD9423E|nr:hypothetical protein [Streptomyces sp. NBC_01022]WRZ78870.1 hypothetical protein OG316_00635 [Streptomyces sp. NBC_01022]WRZ86809.1 hypothetical protein OG316_44260 [Streptomyces sp. NBC_01022]